MTGRNPDRRTAVVCGPCGDTFLRTKNTSFCSDLCRLLAKVDRSGDCWEWMATLDRHGYGTFYLGRNVGAHRASLLLHGVAIPEGLDVDHLCRNRACVRPDHLEVVTRRDNILRGVAPTALTFQMNRCKRGHKFTAANTVIKGGDPSKRQCRTCQNVARRVRYAEQRSA